MPYFVFNIPASVFGTHLDPPPREPSELLWQEKDHFITQTFLLYLIGKRAVNQMTTYMVGFVAYQEVSPK